MGYYNNKVFTAGMGWCENDLSPWRAWQRGKDHRDGRRAQRARPYTVCKCGRWAYNHNREKWGSCQCGRPFFENEWPQLPAGGGGGKKNDPRGKQAEATAAAGEGQAAVADLWQALVQVLDPAQRQAVEAKLPGLALRPPAAAQPSPAVAAQKSFHTLAKATTKRHKLELTVARLEKELHEAKEGLAKAVTEVEEAKQKHQQAVEELEKKKEQETEAAPVLSATGSGGSPAASQPAEGGQPAAAGQAEAEGLAKVEDDEVMAEAEDEEFKQWASTLPEEHKRKVEEKFASLAAACKRQKTLSAQQATRFAQAAAALGEGLAAQLEQRREETKPRV